MSKHDTDTSDQHAAKRRWLNAHEEGYHKAMGNRQVQMIAIGGAIVQEPDCKWRGQHWHWSI